MRSRLRFSALVATGDLAASVSAEQLRERSDSLHFDQPVNIQYTSGTTGFPKGATLSHYNILNNGYMVGESLGLTAADRLVIPVPLYHCFGMVMGNLGCITHGSTMIYPNDAFDPLLTLQTVAEEKPPRCTACRPCSSPCSISRSAPSSTCRPCAPGSWPAPPARSR
jgi:acyl-CoA synthetase (AMP-forming)/AMP-acid ligase II